MVKCGKSVFLLHLYKLLIHCCRVGTVPQDASLVQWRGGSSGTVQKVDQQVHGVWVVESVACPVQPTGCQPSLVLPTECLSFSPLEDGQMCFKLCSSILGIDFHTLLQIMFLFKPSSLPHSSWILFSVSSYECGVFLTDTNAICGTTFHS